MASDTTLPEQAHIRQIRLFFSGGPQVALYGSPSSVTDGWIANMPAAEVFAGDFGDLLYERLIDAQDAHERSSFHTPFYERHVRQAHQPHWPPFKVLLAAIAKDEGAYLPEWIYHHLSIGFSEIWIYVNKTNDNTRSLLSKISAQKPIRTVEADHFAFVPDEQLSHFLDPAFEKGNPLQARAFADIFRKAKDAGFDFVAFFDIDEYLILSEKLNSIQALIKGAGVPSVLKLKWFGGGIEPTRFGIVLSRVITGKKSTQCKLILSTGLTKLQLGSTHHATIRDEGAWAWISGSHHADANASSRGVPTWYKDAYIIHRSYRSKDELLAILYKGDNVDQSQFNGFKLNRLRTRPPSSDKLIFSPMKVREYNQGFNSFIEVLDIRQELRIARTMVLQRASRAKAKYLDIPRNVGLLSAQLSLYGMPSYKVVVEEEAGEMNDEASTTAEPKNNC